VYHPRVNEDQRSFELFAFRFEFRALSSLYFPSGKAGNVVRGALGNLFRKAVCEPGCPSAKACRRRAECAYARLFEPTAILPGPSGLADWPRPFVFRAAHLDGRRFRPEQPFDFDLNVFEIRNPALPYFAFSFSQLMRGGLGPGSGAAELISIYSLNESGEACARVFDGQTLSQPRPLALPLRPQAAQVRRIKVRFRTPTELKAGGKVVREPVFAALFARVRDRIHTLRQLYGAGPLALDFAAMGERARAVKLLGSEVRWRTHERRSGKTGQTHPLQGFTGWAEYEGDLTEFVPYLRAAAWTGVGRQTTWGQGYIESTVLE